MGRCQTETYYGTEASYLKWFCSGFKSTGPDQPCVCIGSGRCHRHRGSVRRTLASPNRRGEIIDLPAFLLHRNSSQYRQRKVITVEGWQLDMNDRSLVGDDAGYRGRI